MKFPDGIFAVTLVDGRMYHRMFPAYEFWNQSGPVVVFWRSGRS
jgi:hypothetical protein